jgi:hypothetical protein
MASSRQSILSQPSSSRVTVGRVVAPGPKERPLVLKSSRKLAVEDTDFDKSVFDYLNILRRHLLVTRGCLVQQVTMASKDAEGLVDWLVLTPSFHSLLVKRPFS